MGNKSGFVLVEMLFSFFISTIVLTGLFLCIVHLKNIKVTNYMHQDIDILSKQLQQILIQATNIEANDNCLTYTLNDQTFNIVLDRHRLVKKDGYEILLFNVDDVKFEGNDFYTMTIFRNDEEFKRIIGLKRLNYD